MKFLFVVAICFSLFLLTLSLRRVDESKPFISRKNSRIVGGELARPGQFPWIAAIWKSTADGRYFCAGSLFNEQWILTAAQCVYNATSFVIQLGSTLLEGEDPNRVTLSTSTYFYEPRFDPTNLRHDVGLIKLHMPVELNDYIQPVRMLTNPVGPIHPGRFVEAAGWGQTSDVGELVNELHFVEMAILGQTECQGYYGEQLWGSMCCAEGNYNEGPCLGDTGTPLMTYAPVGEHSIQVALATFISGNGCESTDPTGYTRTDGTYYRWMLNTTRDN